MMKPIPPPPPAQPHAIPTGVLRLTPERLRRLRELQREQGGPSLQQAAHSLGFMTMTPPGTRPRDTRIADERLETRIADARWRLRRISTTLEVGTAQLRPSLRPQAADNATPTLGEVLSRARQRQSERAKKAG